MQWMMLETEAEYRSRVQLLYGQVEKALANIDPDVAECEQAMGSMSIIFADKSRCILSSQPSVRQLWLALASRGMAYHFNFDEKEQRWVDDKGRGDFNTVFEKFFFDMTGIKITICEP